MEDNMSKQLKTYKFFAIANDQPMRCFNIKALRSDIAEKMARERIAKLELKTGLTWRLEIEPPPMSKRANKIYREHKIKRSATDTVFRIGISMPGFMEKVIEFYKTAEYQSASLSEQALMSLAFAHKELEDNEKYDETEQLVEALKLALELHPLFIEAHKICPSPDLLAWWFINEQAELQGKIPWHEMLSGEGIKKVQRALLHFCHTKAYMMLSAPKVKTSPQMYRVSVSKSGEVNLPEDICKAYNYTIGDLVEIVLDEGDLIIYPAMNRPRAYKKLHKRATEVFADKNEATTWLHRSQFDLDGFRPIDYMFSAEGAQEVEDLLGRMEEGIFV
jgi:antitoxin component of MazEF toxin-antitoxin module